MFSSHCELKGGNMNRKLFIKIIKVTVLMMALFFMFIILNLNTSFAYINHGINYIEITGNASEFYEVPKGTDQIPNAPIRGIRVELENKKTGETFTTLTDKNGDYKFEDIPQGDYTIEYRYGDIGILNEEQFKDSNLIKNLTKKDILKYNGHDYIVSDTQEETTSYKKLERDAAQVFFVIDTSNSMNSVMSSTETGEQLKRIDVVKDAAKKLAKSILDENQSLNDIDTDNPDVISELSELKEKNFYLGLISFDSDVTNALNAYQPYTLTQDYDVMCNAIDNLYAKGNTNVPPALANTKKQMCDNNPDGLKIVIFLTDGVPAMPTYEDYPLTQKEKETELEDKVREQLTDLLDSDIKLYTLFIVKDALGLEDLDNTADIEPEKFKELIGYDEELDKAAPTDEPCPANAYINNYYMYYSYAGYLNHIYELYKDYSDKMTYQSSAEDLSHCMTENIKSWIEEKFDEYNDSKHNNSHDYESLVETKLNDDSHPECGWEDENRRETVDSYFIDTFHNNTSNNSENLSAQSYLFKILDDPDSFSNKTVKNFSDHTYMTITFDLPIIRETKNEVINLCLKRRNEFSLRVSNKVVEAKITLNTGQVVYSDYDYYSNPDFDDPNNKTKQYIFKKEIDSELLHGALIELEYQISIENLSPNIECTYLDLVSYLPPGLYFSENSELLSDSRYTNYDTGWTLDEKTDLLELGYLDHSDVINPHTGLVDPDYLVNRHYIITFSHPLKEDALLPQNTYTTNFVLSTYITNVEDFALYNNSNTDKDIVEIFGYRNTKNRRMEYKNKDQEEYTSVMTKIEAQTPEEEDIYIGGETNYRATYTSIYPGDGKADAPDYAMDYNFECVTPVTGDKPNYTNHIIFAVIIILSSILIIIKIRLKFKK